MSGSSLPRPLLNGVAEILAELADEIECLGEALCGDSKIIERHLAQLQGIDLVAQTARHLAEVLESDHPADALADIRLEALRHRLNGLAGHDAAPSRISLAS